MKFSARFGLIIVALFAIAWMISPAAAVDEEQVIPFTFVDVRIEPAGRFREWLESRLDEV